MSGSSRSTQGQGQAAQPTRLGALDALIVAVAVHSHGATDARRVVPFVKDRANTCNGPTGPCVLSLGRPGNHWRDSPALHPAPARECSICRRVHGSEVIHASE